MLIDLLKRRVKLNFLCDGDSLTYGYGGTISYPTYLMSKFSSPIMHNVAVNGQTSNDLLTNYQSHLDNYYKIGCKNIATIMIGTNDVYQSIDINTTLSNIITAVSAARTKGFSKIFVNTILPFYTGGNNQALFDTWWAGVQSLNNLIRNNATAHGYIVCDLAADSKYNYQNAVYDTSIYSSDLVHQINAGYSHISDIMYQKIINNINN